MRTGGSGPSNQSKEVLRTWIIKLRITIGNGEIYGLGLRKFAKDGFI